ncbi:MAG: tRNA pseudouridine(38-40) synthase TruA [bacterium]|nr:tRNA pseudouridine(38-40) synthase TruA [bacterium]
MHAAARRFRGIIAYEGSAYQGFQRQADGIPTIQGAVETAIHRVTGQPATVTGAGRTDTGVHAAGQVIAFDSAWKHDDQALLRALNVHLPGDIALLRLERLPEGTRFHPRFDAVSRFYSYHIVVSPAPRLPLAARMAWHVREPLDAEAVRAAAHRLTGTHDFGAFGHAPHGENTVRTVIESTWEPGRTAEVGGHRLDEWWYHVEANAFLQHMVRRIVGSLVDVGRGARSLDDFVRHFQGGKLASHWTTAPPQGLTLVRVRYPDAVQE